MIFATKGSAATLEEVARDAGFGIGTLYRHFPSRDALIEAVYRNETEQLVAAAERLSRSHPPVEALRAWLLLFVDYLGAKRGISAALDTLVASTSELFAASAELMTGATKLLVDRAVASGEIRLAMAPIDLLRAVAGMAHVGSGPKWKAAARQLVDLLITGMRRA